MSSKALMLALALAWHVLFVLALSVHANVAPIGGGCTCTPNTTKTFVVYIQIVSYTGTNSNYTSYPVAGIQGAAFGGFGTITVYDDPVTRAASPTSALLGRVRGIYADASLDGVTLYVSATFQFTSGQHANSTLNIEGLGNTLVNVPAKLGISGGTKAFKDAVGHVTLLTISRQGPNSVVQATIDYKIAV